jgi:NitT/TauT family transport system substrate-binding protein/sulfonate transport system substrate-binding protein
MLVFVFSAVQAQTPIKIKTCWIPQFHAFLPWLAHQKGWDKEEGLDMELIPFDSGMAELETLPAKQWVVGGIGGVGMVLGALRHDAYEIGLLEDDSFTNVVFVRPDSPILKTKGFNKDYPDIYGSPETVKGKSILVTTVSSVHYAMSSWLKALGLKDSDVVIKQMDQSSALTAFEKGIGDVVVLWAPFCFKAQSLGWKKVSDIHMCKIAEPDVLIGDKEFCDKNPETVAKFLRVYFRAVNYVEKYRHSNPEILKVYQKYLNDYGMKITLEQAKMEFDSDANPLWSLQEQLKLLDSSKGESTAQKWQDLIAEFFTAQGRFTQDEFAQVSKKTYVTDKFLKLVKTPIPTDDF